MMMMMWVLINVAHWLWACNCLQSKGNEVLRNTSDRNPSFCFIEINQKTSRWLMIFTIPTDLAGCKCVSPNLVGILLRRSVKIWSKIPLQIIGIDRRYKAFNGQTVILHHMSYKWCREEVIMKSENYLMYCREIHLSRYLCIAKYNI